MNDYKKSYGGREELWSVRYKKDLAGDCTVRSISIATEIPYIEVWNEMFDIGRTHGWMPNDDRTFEKFLASRGWHKRKMLKKPDGKRYQVKEFPLTGRCILRTQRHLTALVDGCIYDTWDCRRQAVGNYYTKS